MNLTTTHTYVKLTVPEELWLLVREKLLAADYQHALIDLDGQIVLNMTGIALVKEVNKLFLIIENGEGDDPMTITTCKSAKEREKKTREMIGGPGWSGDSVQDKIIKQLKETGKATFEGDPSIEWKEGFIRGG